MNLIRKHKISLITNEPLTGSDQEIIDFIQDKLSGLIPFKYEDYPYSIFYMKDSKVLLEQDSKNDRLWCRYEGFWSVLAYDYNMEYEDAQSIIKYMVEQAFKQQAGTPSMICLTSVTVVEQAFKQQQGTQNQIFNNGLVVERYFKIKWMYDTVKKWNILRYFKQIIDMIIK